MSTNKKILIVEDDPLLSKTLEDALRDAKFDVILSRDGEEGLATAFSNHPDLILLDILMPKMDGLTMYKKLQEDEWGKQVAVMMLTAVTDKDKIVEAKQGGVYYYLIKENFEPKDVVNKIKERLGLDQPRL